MNWKFQAICLQRMRKNGWLLVMSTFGLDLQWKDWEETLESFETFDQKAFTQKSS